MPGARLWSGPGDRRIGRGSVLCSSKHSPSPVLIITASMVTGWGQRSREVAPSQPDAVDSPWTADLAWTSASEDAVFPSSGHGRVCCQEGTQVSAELPPAGECPSRRVGEGAGQEALFPHIGLGPILPKGCEVPGSYPWARLSDLMAIMAAKCLVP